MANVLDLLIRVRDQLGGLDRANKGFEKLKAGVASMGSEVTQSLIGTFGVGAAVGLVISRFQQLRENIDKIEGIDQETIQSVHDWFDAWDGFKELIDESLASILVWGQQTGTSVARTIGLLVHGEKEYLAIEADAQRAREGAKAAVEALAAARRKHAEAIAAEAAAAAAAQKQWLTEAIAADAAIAARERADRTAGQQADFLDAQIAQLERRREETDSQVEKEQLLARIEQAKLERSTIVRALMAQLATLGEEQRKAAFEALPAAAQLVHLKEKLAGIEAELAKQSLDTNADLERTIALEEERLATAAAIKTLTSATPEIRPPDPKSFKEQLEAVFGATTTYAQTAANGASAFFGAMTNEIQQNIDDLLLGTQGLRDTVSGIWIGFLGSMRQAFSSMVAEWGVNQLKMVAQYAVSKAQMFALDKAFSLKSIALSVAAAAKSLVAWIPAALAALVSSFGLAGAIGLAAGVALFGAAASGGFEDGGYTGGRPGEPRGIVHGAEYVFSAPAVANAGARSLDALHSALLSPAPQSSSAASSGQQSQPLQLTIGFLDTSQSVEEFFKGAKGQKILYDRDRQTAREVG